MSEPLALTPNVLDGWAVEQFEHLVHSQQPATAPWQPVTDYSFEARKAIEGKQPELIKEVFQPQYVLDYGCGPGHLVSLLRDLGVEAEGYDPQAERFREQAQPNARPHIAGEKWCVRTCDLVVCREVLEHCTVLQAVELVRDLAWFSNRYIYITTRFAKEPQHLLDVDTADELDPTHITMLTKPFLRLLFVLHGCKSRPDLEAKMDWQNKGRCLVFEV